MIYYATIPNGPLVEELLVESTSSAHAFVKARQYLYATFGRDVAPDLVVKWSELAKPAENGVVHFSHGAEDRP